MQVLLGIFVPLLGIVLAKTSLIKKQRTTTLITAYTTGCLGILLWLTTTSTALDLAGIHTEISLFYISFLLIFLTKNINLGTRLFAYLLFGVGMFPINLFLPLIVGFATSYTVIPFHSPEYVGSIGSHRIQTEEDSPGMSRFKSVYLVKQGLLLEEKIRKISPSFFYNEIDINEETKELYFISKVPLKHNSDSVKTYIDTVKLDL